jgi:ABC-type lipoprotein release transport system permease subunit
MMSELSPTASVQRQIVLPLGKAVEIAYKSIRLRLARSLLVTSGIVLALAFLASVLTTEALTAAMRQWVAQSQSSTDLSIRRSAQQLEAQMKSSGLPTTQDEIASARMQTRWVVGLALMVAFVGILNAMLMSVTERFREIGTMKCLGALDGFIVKLFVIESLFQGLVGTIVGIIAGLLLGLVSHAISYHTAGFANFPMSRVLLNVLICLLIGVALTVAGAVYPAWQAARMQPVEAMRVEA